MQERAIVQERAMGGFGMPPGSPSQAGSPLQDAEAVQRVLRGDVDAYRPLVEKYQRAVSALSRRLVGAGGDAEDLAQESFVRAYRYLGTLQNPERFGPWLFRVVRSLARDRNIRRDVESRILAERRLRLRTAQHSVCGGLASVGDGVELLLEGLPPEESQVLLLRYQDGLSFKEIGAQLRLSFHQVDHLIRQARARLARKLRREK